MDGMKIQLYLFIFNYLAVRHGMWGLKFPDQGLNLYSLQWKHRVLTAGPPGKSQDSPLDTSSFRFRALTIKRRKKKEGLTATFRE